MLVVIQFSAERCSVKFYVVIQSSTSVKVGCLLVRVQDSDRVIINK